MFGPVEDLDVQGADEGFDQVGWGVVELAGEVGQFVEQGGVLVRGSGCGQVVELGLGAGVLVVQLGVPGLDALPVGLGGGAGVGAESFQLGEQPGLGGGDAGQLGGQVVVLALPGGVAVIVPVAGPAGWPGRLARR